MSEHMETSAMGYGNPGDAPHQHHVPHAPHEGLTLPQHEANSAHRAAHIEHSIQKLKEHTMSISDREGINIFQRDGLGHGSGMGMGAGVGGFAGAALGSLLLGGRRGGLFGGDVDGSGGAETRVESDIFNTAVLAKLGTIEAAIPLAAAQTENVILQQTNALTNIANQNALANQAAFANLKDSVQGAAVVNLAATNAQGDRIVALINANEVANLNRQLTVADLDRREEASRGRSREVEVNVSQVVNQAQAQAQAQQQAQLQTNLLGQLVTGFGGFANQLNNVHQGIVQIGAANVATPTTTNTNVR